MPPIDALDVYCEKGPTRDRAAAVLDVADVRDLKELARDSWDPEDQRSLLEFVTPYAPQGQLREGTWYRLPLDNLKFEASPASDGSALVRGRLLSDQPVRGSSIRIPPMHVDAAPTGDWSEAIPIPTDNLRLVVADCGQGNWNEIVSDQARILYDTGCSYQWTTQQVTAFLNARALHGESRETHAIISHWDVDHYHALLHANDAQLRAVRVITAPDRPPNTATCRRFLARMTQLSVPVHFVPAAASPPGDGRAIHLHEAGRRGPLTILRATRGVSRNQTGIVLLAAGPLMTAVMPGDHHHDKVLLAMQRCEATSCDAVYVIPHHGGRAGRFAIQSWSTAMNSVHAVVSYGRSNPYDHPFPDVMTSVSAIASGRIHHTATDGTYSTRL